MEVIAVREATDVAEVRRLAKKLAQVSALNSQFVEQAAIIATEAGTNILKYAGQGKILLNSTEVGLELLALDKGPGIPNLDLAMQDGYSTSGSQGTGLGAIRRLSTQFDVYSPPGKGTALWANLMATTNQPKQVYALSLPKPGEIVCGDGWATASFSESDSYLVVDGLGHGQDAHEAAQEAVQVFNEYAAESPLALMNRIHPALKKTRGAAAAIVRLDRHNRQARFAGIGNIHAVLLGGAKTQVMVSMNGTLGHQIRSMNEFTYTWTGDRPAIIMHSDGLITRWSLEEYPGLMRKSLPLIAGVLFRDFNREYDDITILVAQPK